MTLLDFQSVVCIYKTFYIICGRDVIALMQKVNDGNASRKELTVSTQALRNKIIGRISWDWRGKHKRFPESDDDDVDNDGPDGENHSGMREGSLVIEPITHSNTQLSDEGNHSEMKEESLVIEPISPIDDHFPHEGNESEVMKKESDIEIQLKKQMVYVNHLLGRTAVLVRRDGALRVVGRAASIKERREFREELLSIQKHHVYMLERLIDELGDLEIFHKQINLAVARRQIKKINPNIDDIVKHHHKNRALLGTLHAQLIGIQNSISVKLCTLS